MSVLVRRLGGACAHFALVVALAITFAFLVEWARPGGSHDPRPVWELYASYWTDLLEPDVAGRIWRALPWTVALVGTATTIAFAVGTLIGAWLARPGRRIVASVSTLPLMLLACVPAYLIGMVLVAIVSQHLRWLPPALGYSPTQLWSDRIEVILDLAGHAALPIAAITLAGIGMFAISRRGAVAVVAGDDHTLYAESLGLPERRIFWAHHLRPALLPQVTAFALALGVVVSGALLLPHLDPRVQG